MCAPKPSPPPLPLAGLQAEVSSLVVQAASVRSEAKGADARLAERRERLRECDVEIRGLEKEREKLQRAVHDLEAECKRAEGK